MAKPIPNNSRKRISTWEQLDAGSILKFQNPPFFDPQAYDSTAHHPCFLLERYDNFCVVMTLTTFKPKEHAAHVIQVHRINNGWALPVMHARAPDLGGFPLITEAQPNVSHTGEETLDPDLDAYLRWRPQTMDEPGLAQFDRLFVCHYSELYVYIDHGMRFRIDHSSVQQVRQMLLKKPFHEIYERAVALAAAAEANDNEAVAVVHAKYEEMFRELDLTKRQDKCRLNRGNEDWGTAAEIEKAQALRRATHPTDKYSRKNPRPLAMNTSTDIGGSWRKSSNSYQMSSMLTAVPSVPSPWSSLTKSSSRNPPQNKNGATNKSRNLGGSWRKPSTPPLRSSMVPAVPPVSNPWSSMAKSSSRSPPLNNNGATSRKSTTLPALEPIKISNLFAILEEGEDSSDSPESAAPKNN